MNAIQATQALVARGFAYDDRKRRFQPTAEICHNASGQHMGALIIDDANTHYGFRAYCHSCARHVTKEVAKVIGYTFGGAGTRGTKQAFDQRQNSAAGIADMLRGRYAERPPIKLPPTWPQPAPRPRPAVADVTCYQHPVGVVVDSETGICPLDYLHNGGAMLYTDVLACAACGFDEDPELLVRGEIAGEGPAWLCAVGECYW